MQSLGLTFLDLIFPPTCPACGKLGEHWCEDCQNNVNQLATPICKRCGIPLKTQTTNCNCSEVFTHLDSLRSFAYYEESIRTAIKQFKFNRDFALSKSLAIYLINLYNGYKIEGDTVIPVPLNPNRLRERGFNQAALLAKVFAKEVELPCETQALFRKKNTRSQVGLSRKARLMNVNTAFIANPPLVEGKHIILIDDVSTTGATLEACAKALKFAGAKTVNGLTVARAVKTKAGYSDSESTTTAVLT